MGENVRHRTNGFLRTFFMKTVILAGGYGTRLSEETELKPKPLVEIGGYPILWHIMKIYAYYGFNEFVVLTGYKSHLIKEYFVNYYQRYSDMTVDMANNTVEVHKTRHEPWKITLLYTGQDTMTGSRLKRARDYLGNEQFLMTYGDAVADVDIFALIESHEKSGKSMTVTAVLPPGRFGALKINAADEITGFQEKPKGDGAWINGGFFVCNPDVFDYLPDFTTTVLEEEPMRALAADGKLNAYKHLGFWQPMDTLRDKNMLTQLWYAHQAPWAKWEGTSGV